MSSLGLAALSFLAGMVSLFFAGCADNFGAEPENDCLIVAAKAQVAIPRSVWNRLLVVRYDNASLQHVYLVYEVGPQDLAIFDNNRGTQHLRTSVRDPSALARLIDPFAKWGWYVEDNAHHLHLAAN